MKRTTVGDLRLHPLWVPLVHLHHAVEDSCGLMSNAANKQSSEDEDENRVDFGLLQQRHRSRASSDSTIMSDERDETRHSPKTDEVWPLHLTPKFIDHYITGDLIGSGSYAEVRECVDTRTLERCALKVINKEYLLRQAPRALANQLQEIRILRHLRHANIISMRECLQKGPFIYIALEYCSFNLNELLKEQAENRFQLTLARRFFHQLCFGLRYLHSLGIVHRDIKPDNLLLTNAGTLKIIDFGVSHILSMWQRADWCSNYEGTPLFQAPEVISGQLEYLGFKVDVWSCGVTLFLMLFGSYPFMDEALLGLYDKILSQDLRVPQEAAGATSRALADLLAAMLDKHPRKRASIDQVLAHPWLKLCHANLHDSDELEQPSDLFELATAPAAAGNRKGAQDVYRSMSVLPYLYRHHFPSLPIRKRSRSGGSTASDPSNTGSGPKLERLNSISSSSTSDTDANLELGESRQSNEQPAEEVEWGTEQQYQLMKVPQVRANRVRPNGRARRRRRPRRGWRRPPSPPESV